MNQLPGVLALGLFLLLAGCASLSKDECLNADWQLIGYEDGANGAAVNRIGEHRKACADHGVTPDMAAYTAGYDQGIQAFCTEERGYRAGQYGQRANQVCPRHTDYVIGYESGLGSYCTYDSGYDAGIGGKSYLRVCPMSLEGEFLSGYELGSDIFALRDELGGLLSHIDEVIEEQEQVEEDIKLIQKQVIFDKELSVAERLSLVEEMNTLSDRHDELDAEHFTLDARVAEINTELDRLGAR